MNHRVNRWALTHKVEISLIISSGSTGSSLINTRDNIVIPIKSGNLRINYLESPRCKKDKSRGTRVN